MKQKNKFDAEDRVIEEASGPTVSRLTAPEGRVRGGGKVGGVSKAGRSLSAARDHWLLCSATRYPPAACAAPALPAHCPQNSAASSCAAPSCAIPDAL